MLYTYLTALKFNTHDGPVFSNARCSSMHDWVLVACRYIRAYTPLCMSVGLFQVWAEHFERSLRNK